MLFSRYLLCIKPMSFKSSTYIVKQHNNRLIWDAHKTFHVYWSDLDMSGNDRLDMHTVVYCLRFEIR